MNSSQISCFLLAAGKLSFTETATELFLSPQAVSKQIASLEADLSTRLFERNGPHLRLTPTGEMYYRLFTGSQRQLSFLLEDVRLRRRSLALELRIGVSEWIDASNDFGRGLDAFGRLHPGCRRSVSVLTNGELIAALKADRLDCVFFSGAQRPQHRNLAGRPVAQEQMMLYTPDDLGSGPAQEDCWGLPLLLVPAWDWSFMELRIVGAREASGVRLSPAKTLLLPNYQSMYAQMEFSRSATLGGSRFSPFLRIPGLSAHRIGQTDDIYCVWQRENASPLIPDLTEALRAFFAYPDGDAPEDGAAYL